LPAAPEREALGCKASRFYRREKSPRSRPPENHGKGGRVARYSFESGRRHSSGRNKVVPRKRLLSSLG